MKKSLGPIILAYPMPVWVIGTYGGDGKPNAATAAAGMVCCRKPPCIAVSFREATYTYHNLKARQAFTVNIPSESHIKETDYFGIATGRREDKFAATGLSPIPSSLVDAPYVGEFPMVLECKLIHTLELGSHTQFIGEILDVKAEMDVLGEKGFPNLKKLKPLVYDIGQATYYGIGEFLGKAFTLGQGIIRP